MRTHAKRTPAEWFQAAVHCYLEKHQGCASCGQQHCVFQSHWSQRIEYYCSACDFSVCHDKETGQTFASEGDGRQLANALLGHLNQGEDANLV